MAMNPQRSRRSCKPPSPPGFSAQAAAGLGTSPIGPLRFDALAGEHGPGGGLLPRPLGATQPLRRRPIGDFTPARELGMWAGSRAPKLPDSGAALAPAPAPSLHLCLASPH